MAASSSPDRHISAAKRRLGHLAGIGARTEDAETQIHDAAVDKLEAVQTDLTKLHQRALTDPEIGRQYESLLVERGQLETILAQSRLALGR